MDARMVSRQALIPTRLLLCDFHVVFALLQACRRRGKCAGRSIVLKPGLKFEVRSSHSASHCRIRFGFALHSLFSVLTHLSSYYSVSCPTLSPNPCQKLSWVFAANHIFPCLFTPTRPLFSPSRQTERKGIRLKLRYF